jgi:hypothetical protein
MPDTPHSPAPAAPPKKRCLVYVDGFNLYYGVLEPHPEWKWLNLQSLFDALRPDEDIVTGGPVGIVLRPLNSQPSTLNRLQ